MLTDRTRAAGSNAINGVVERLNLNPPNELPNEVYRSSVEAGWDDQWLNRDDLGDDDPG
jgi:hypothetical protein